MTIKITIYNKLFLILARILWNLGFSLKLSVPRTITKVIDMDSNKEIIKYLTFNNTYKVYILGSTQEEADHLYDIVVNRITDDYLFGKIPWFTLRKNKYEE